MLSDVKAVFFKSEKTICLVIIIVYFTQELDYESHSVCSVVVMTNDYCFEAAKVQRT